MTPTQTLTELYVHESGTPGAPAIVFLHPTAANGRMWEQHMGRLAGYHCLAPDLPGHGRSNHLPWTSLDDTARQVAALIEDCIPARRAHMVGLSLGGAVVHKLLAHHPELLDRVVIDGCGGGVLPARGVWLWKLAFALTAPLIHRNLVIGLLHRYLGGDPGDRAGRARFAADLRAVSPAAFRRSFADANDKKNRFSREELSASCPILLVAGEREPGTIRASNAALAALMPNAVARFVPGAGHAWLTAEPELHVRMVDAWISGQELPAGLAPEITQWPSSQVQRLLDDG
jgi:pimeloyl-ACP methyl ester carboxylesterase